MKRIIAFVAAIVLPACLEAQAPAPAKAPTISLTPDLFITRMFRNPVQGTSTFNPFCIGNTNVVVLNIENRGGNVFRSPVEVVLTAQPPTKSYPGPTYRSSIDGNTAYVTPYGKRVYVVTFRNVRVNSGWSGANWWYEAEMRTTGPRGGMMSIGNKTRLPVGWNLTAC